MALHRFGTIVTEIENDTTAPKSGFKKGNDKRRAVLGDIGNQAAHFGDMVGFRVADVKLKKLSSRTKGSLPPQPAVVRELDEHAFAKPLSAKSPEPMDMEDVGEALEECFGMKIVDIDAEDHDNPQLCAEYVNEIYRYFRSLEKKFSVPADYMNNQVEINDRMRSILVDWLIQVHLRFRLLQETLYMTVSIIDRFLAVENVQKLEFQLVGVSAMLLASKYEEIYAPEIQDFVIVTDKAFTQQQIRKMEALIFQKLDYNLGKPHCLHFLRRNSKAGGVDATKHTLAKYFMELCLVDYQSVKFLPSEIAAAALCLSIKAIDNSKWDDTLGHYSKYSERSLKPCMQRMAQLVRITADKNCKWNAVPKKYASSKFMTVSLLPCSQPSYLEKLVEC